MQIAADGAQRIDELEDLVTELKNRSSPQLTIQLEAVVAS